MQTVGVTVGDEDAEGQGVCMDLPPAVRPIVFNQFKTCEMRKKSTLKGSNSEASN